MDCDKTRKLLSDYLDNALSSADKKDLDEHLRSCTQCTASLKELQKTVGILHDLEEITPPAWMTQKIMSRIKTEAEQKKKGLFQKLFFPLYVKLPMEAAGIVLIAITALYVYKTMEPEIKPATVYSERPAVTSPLKDQSLPAHPIRKQEQQSQREKTARPPAPIMSKKDERVGDTSSVGENKPLPAPAFAPAPPPTAEQPMPAKEEAFRENRSGPAELKAKGTLERGLPATGGMAARDQLRQEASRPAAKKAAAPTEKVDIVLSLKANDLNDARKDIKEILYTLGGRIIKEEPGQDILIVMGELNSDNILQFMNKLKALGYLKERIPTPISDKERVMIKITVSKQQTPETGKDRY